MFSVKTPVRAIVFGAIALTMATFTGPTGGTALADTGVKVIVDGNVITSSDIAKRTNFLKLQHQKGNLPKTAQDQLINETLKRAEISRVRMSVTTQEVDAAFGRFASSNKMSTEQLTQVLDKTGVGVEHFKSYIAVSMSWPRVVNARFGSNKMSNDDLVKRMTEQKEKPVTTEYFLKQIIFVIPASKKGAITGKRKAEAEASRAKFPGCDQAKVFAATMLDVSVRDLGRVLAPNLPEAWKPLIEKATGNTTPAQVTDQGVEYLAICSQRQVNDDVAAAAVFRAEDLGKKGNEQVSADDKKYMDELRSKAQIVYR
jgi:peptidyl-prolyl cis-trans isomerase SurA